MLVFEEKLLYSILYFIFLLIILFLCRRICNSKSCISCWNNHGTLTSSSVLLHLINHLRSSIKALQSAEAFPINIKIYCNLKSGDLHSVYSYIYIYIYILRLAFWLFQTLSSWATSSVEEVASTGPGIRFFQLYVSLKYFLSVFLIVHLSYLSYIYGVCVCVFVYLHELFLCDIFRCTGTGMWLLSL